MRPLSRFSFPIRALCLFCIIAVLLAVSRRMLCTIQRHQLNVNLFAAMEANDLPAVRKLLAQGADPNYRYPLPATLQAHICARLRGESLTRPIIMPMAYHGRTVIVQALIEHGLNIHSVDNDGTTALMWAAQQGHTDLVSLLLAHGADLRARDEKRYTALICATWSGNPTTVATLLQAGSEVNAQCLRGNTALTEAVDANEESIVVLLLEHHARPDLKVKGATNGSVYRPST